MRASQVLDILDTVGSGANLTDSEQYDTEFYDTGLYLLNFLLSGSLFGGCPSKINSLAAPEFTGKSYFLHNMAKAFLNADPDNVFLLYETEGALDKTKFINLLGKENAKRVKIVGVDQDIFILENFAKHITSVLDKMKDASPMGKSNLMIGVDSYGAFISNVELEAIKAGEIKASWETQKISKKIFKAISSVIARLKIPMVITAHLTPNVMGNPYGPKTAVTGGQGLRYFSRNIFEMTKVKNQEDSENGSTARFKVFHKAMYVVPSFKMDIPFFFNRTLGKCNGLLEFLLEEKLLIKSRGPVYSNSEYGISFAASELENKELDALIGKKNLRDMDEILQKRYKYGSDMAVDFDAEDTAEETEDKPKVFNVDTATRRELKDYIVDNFPKFLKTAEDIADLENEELVKIIKENDE